MNAQQENARLCQHLTAMPTLTRLWLGRLWVGGVLVAVRCTKPVDQRSLCEVVVQRLRLNTREAAGIMDAALCPGTLGDNLPCMGSATSRSHPCARLAPHRTASSTIQQGTHH